MTLRQIVLLIVVPVVVIVMGGCRAAAVEEVKAVVAQYDSHLQSSPSRIQVDSADEYLDEVASEIRSACRAIDERRRAELPEDERPEEPELDFYDKFNIYLVHSPAPNAATPGDDCAYITSRLMLEAERPEQVYAVAAHEFGHIRNLHQVDQVERRLTHEVAVIVITSIGAGLDAYAGSNNPYHQQQNWGKIANNAMRAYVPWRKSDEFEADLTGLEIYLEMGLDPEGYISLFEMMRERWGDGGGVSHPRLTDRISRLRDALAQHDDVYRHRRMSDRRFRSMQAAVAEELERLEARGFLIAEEVAMVERLNSGILTSRISCCGPTDFDPTAMLDGFNEIVERRGNRWR